MTDFHIVVDNFGANTPRLITCIAALEELGDKVGKTAREFIYNAMNFRLMHMHLCNPNQLESFVVELALNNPRAYIYVYEMIPVVTINFIKFCQDTYGERVWFTLLTDRKISDYHG